MKHLIAVTVALLISSGAVAATDEAVQVDSGFPVGTPGRMEKRAEDHLAFIPQTTTPGGQFFYVCVSVDHLQAGRALRLDIVWPAALKLDAASGPVPKGDAARNYQASFAAVAPQVTFQSGDLRAWTPVAGVTLADENTVRVPVVGAGEILGPRRGGNVQSVFLRDHRRVVLHRGILAIHVVEPGGQNLRAPSARTSRALRRSVH